MIAIIAALPREVAGLVHGWTVHQEQRHRGVFAWRRGQAVVVAAGMGGNRAALAVEAAFKMGECSQLISAGLAGACDPAIAVGSVLEASKVVDVRTGERFSTTAARGSVLATADSIASVREKGRLFAAYGAALVDMEAATVGRLARAHGLPFRAIKGVSDGWNFELASLGNFATKHGHFNTPAFALHTAVRPHMWGKTMRLGRDSHRALRALQQRLQEELGV